MSKGSDVDRALTEDVERLVTVLATGITLEKWREMLRKRRLCGPGDDLLWVAGTLSAAIRSGKLTVAGDGNKTS